MARNPARDGWRVLMRAPESILAEIGWRWAFGAALWGLLFFSFREYFAQIEITPGEYAMLKTFEPFLWSTILARVMQAFVDGVRDMGPILVPALCILWLALATIGRAATVRALAKDGGVTNWASLIGLNLFRLLMTFAALLAYVGGAILVTRTFDPQQNYVLDILLMLVVVLALAMAWGVVNWFISLAQIFAAQSNAGFTTSIRNAADLYQSHSGDFVSSGLWFSFLRLILIVLVTLGSLSPLGQMTLGGIRTVAVFIIVVSLLYFAAADALNMWRLGVYLSLLEPEETEPVLAQNTGNPDLAPTEGANHIPPPPPEEWKPIAEN